MLPLQLLQTSLTQGTPEHVRERERERDRRKEEREIGARESERARKREPANLASSEHSLQPVSAPLDTKIKPQASNPKSDSALKKHETHQQEHAESEPAVDKPTDDIESPLSPGSPAHDEKEEPQKLGARFRI